MTPWDVILQMQAALRADAGLAAWCQDTYGRGLYIALGFRLDESPGKDQTPCVMLSSAVTDDDLEKPADIIAIRGLLGLYDKDVSASGLDRVQLGQQRLSDEFAPLVLAALKRALGPGLSLARVITHDFSKDPVFELGLDLTVNHRRSIGVRR